VSAATLSVVPRGRARTHTYFLPLPEPLRSLSDEIDTRIAELPTRSNEYGYDAFGMDVETIRRLVLPFALLYRYWFRAGTTGIERVPAGRVLLVANHAGNTFPFDGVMLALALFFEATPPRVVRGMGEYYLPRIPFFSVFMHRMGSVVGTPENCGQLLQRGEAIAVFPEGHRGFIKPYHKRYQLQRFGLGFMRLALDTRTPIVPIGIAGGEEQMPGLLDVKWLGRLFGAPAFPVTLTFPWLGLAGLWPLPIKYRIHFGEPLLFEGDPHEEDREVEKKVDVVKLAIRELVGDARSARRSWFF